MTRPEAIKAQLATLWEEMDRLDAVSANAQRAWTVKSLEAEALTDELHA